jgi:cytoskeleton protein RodZ
MSNVSHLPSTDERKEKRRLHLREIAQEADEPTARPTFDRVGTLLRQARLERGEDPSLIAAALKMRRDQLDAIEENDFAKLPGRTYAVGFVRAYARYLGLDAEAMVQRFKEESDNDIKPVEYVFPEAQEEQRMLPNSSILIWAMLIALVIYVISYLTMPSRKTPAATARAEEPAVIIVDPKTVPKLPAPKLERSAALSGEEPSFVVGGKVLPDSDALTSTQFLADDPTVPQPTVAPVAPLVEVPSSASQPAAANARIVFKAIEESYIRVHNPAANGKQAILISRVLQPGESYAAPHTTGLVMQTGNAGGLQVEVDGRVIGVVGKRGEVITRMPLEASYFLDRIAATQ